MKSRPLAIRGPSAFACVAAIAATAEARMRRATVLEVVRLTPARSLQLPSAFVRERLADGCRVPQPMADARVGTVANVISGSFARRGPKDDAVLCSSVGGVSHIRVHGGGRARCPSRIEHADDLSQLDEIEPGVLGYGRAIDPASQATIASFREGTGGPMPPDRTHGGIADVHRRKASIIRYGARGSWMQRQGMD